LGFVPMASRDNNIPAMSMQSPPLSDSVADKDIARPLAVDDFDRFIFIVGAPRCGTTSLARFLKGHPAVAFPLIKEPHFFALNDLRQLSQGELKQRVEREYLQRFFHRDASRRVGVDASVTYLYAPEQLEPIMRLWPDSRFVVSVRDPLAMLPSLHRRLIYVGLETIPTFAKAWAASADRAAGRRIPRKSLDSRLLRYDEAGRFSTYLERLFAVVGRERCHVQVFDDLTADPEGQYRRLMAFAGLEPQGGVDFSPRRPGQSVRIRWLQRVLKQPPKVITDHLVRNMVETKSGIGGGKASRSLLSLRKRLLRWNRGSRPAESMPYALQTELASELQNEIDRLGTLLNRDLTHWLQPREEAAQEPRARRESGDFAAAPAE